MTEPAAAEFRRRYADIEARLARALTAAEREAVKRDIIALFKDVDATLAEMGEIKESIRVLVDGYKQTVAAADPGAGPRLSGSAPAVHADHIGASTFIEKGWSLISLGEYASAIQVLEKALALSPDATEAQSLLGWAQMHAEQYDEALSTFSRVLMREPANALARINVGYICLKKRIFGEAIEHLSRAIRLDNDRKATLYAHFYLGLVYLEREMYVDAQSFFRKTLALGPNMIEAWYELGRAQWLADDRDGALESWGEGWRANRLSPHGKRCKEMLDLVASGGDIPRRQSA
jgi:tetratricopeptide (TPR) repeat protein